MKQNSNRASLVIGLCLLVCAGLTQSAGFAVQAAHTGSWFDPEQSGHGFLIEVLDEQRALVWWFTFDENGNQAWLGNVGSIFLDRIIVNAVQAQGGFFPPDFDPSQVEFPPWGSLIISFDSCDQASASWETSKPGFSSGSMPLTRLTGLEAVPCELPLEGTPIRNAGAPHVADGVIGLFEWEQHTFFEIEVQADWTVAVRVASDGANLHFMFENLAGPDRINALTSEGPSGLFPELFLDLAPADDRVWDRDNHWFHVSFDHCYLVGDWNQLSACAPQLPLWSANNWPLPVSDIIEISISYERIGLQPETMISVGAVFSLSSALRGQADYRNWPAAAVVADPLTWGRIILPKPFGG